MAECCNGVSFMLSVVYAECRYAECRYAERRYAHCCGAKSRACTIKNFTVVINSVLSKSTV